MSAETVAALLTQIAAIVARLDEDFEYEHMLAVGQEIDALKIIVQQLSAEIGK